MKPFNCLWIAAFSFVLIQFTKEMVFVPYALGVVFLGCVVKIFIHQIKEIIHG